MITKRKEPTIPFIQISARGISLAIFNLDGTVTIELYDIRASKMIHTWEFQE